MYGQVLALRCRAAVSWIRARVSFRLIRRVTLVILALGFLGVSTEALIRARLGGRLDRVPTALYTRPNPWGGDRNGARPVALGALPGAVMERRSPIALSELPVHLVQAVIAAEDQRFYQHHGLDPKRIAGAMVANVRAGGIAQGGSTITQQLAKNLFLDASKTPLRKLREAAMAIALELRYDKRTILEAYLNEIYLGQDGERAIHGVGAAARFYFGKDVRRLTLSESALLVGMISAPNRYAPTRNPDLARDRRALVLSVMAQQGRITRATADRSSRVGLPTRAFPSSGLDGRYYRDFTLAALDHRLPRRGLAVFTTLDAALQRAAERAVQDGMNRSRLRGAESALVAIDPRTGDILAMVGGTNYGASQFNRATDALRQPGSAFKPIVALAALERQSGGAPAFTLASVVDDEPLRVRTPAGPWEPANYDRQFHGRVTLREAMEQSLNVPFARIGLAVGPDRIVETARRMGITSPLRPVPSLALGSSEVTLLELVRAYGVLAAGGYLARPRAVVAEGRYGTTVRDSGGARPERVVDPAVAYLVTSALEGVVTRGTGRALNEDGRFEGIAGKTGTSNDWRDAWFVAYSPTLVVGVWVGYDDGRSLGLTGAGAALPIVARFLSEAASDDRWGQFEVPEGITEGYTTLADGGWGSCGDREVFLEGTEPEGGCELSEPAWSIPHIELPRDWGRRLERSARRLIEELLSRRGEKGGER